MKLKLTILTILAVCSLNLSAKDYKASLFGIKSDGTTLNTGSIQKAIDYISENGGGSLVFYVGRYLTGSVELKSNVTIRLEEGAILMGTVSAYDYQGIDGTNALIYAKGQTNIGVTGKGVIQGQGAAVVETFKTQLSKGYLKGSITTVSPLLIYFTGCTDVTIDSITLEDAASDVQSYKACKNLKVTNVIVKSKLIPASKGLVLSGSEGVTISDSYFDVSGTPLSSAGTSKNVATSKNVTAAGKAVQANK